MVFKYVVLLFWLSLGLFAKNYEINFQTINLSNWHRVGTWERVYQNNKALLFLKKRSSYAFNLCYTKAISFNQGTICVRFKAVSGRIDQGGGIMWRVQDNHNYYIARFNPLEDNFRFYSVKNAKRHQIASARLTLDKGWHEMCITQEQDHISASIDGKTYIKTTDSTHTQSGGVGLWTKADAQTLFDKLSIQTGAK